MESASYPDGTHSYENQQDHPDFALDILSKICNKLIYIRRLLKDETCKTELAFDSRSSPHTCSVYVNLPL